MNWNNFIFRIKIFFSLIILIPCISFAEDWENYGEPVCDNSPSKCHYIRDGGSGNGSSWSNAWGDLPTSFTRGHKYYISDGNYGGHDFDTAMNGTDYIFIKKATHSDHGSNNGWSSPLGDGVANVNGTWVVHTSNWVFDGQKGGGPGSWNTGHGFKITVSSGKNFSQDTGADIDNVKVFHFDMGNGGNTASGGHDNLYLPHLGSGKQTGWHIAYNYLHDANRVNLMTKKHNGTILEYNLFARNHSDSAVHGEAWSAEYDDNMVVRNNIFEDNVGSAIIYVKKNGKCSAAVNGWQIYKNVFWHTPSFRNTAFPGSGVFGRGNENEANEGCSQSAGDVNGLKFYNNTIAGIYTNKKTLCNAMIWNQDDGSNNRVWGNLLWKVTTSQKDGWFGGGIVASDNWYYNITKYQNNEDITAYIVANEQGAIQGNGDPFSNSDSRDSIYQKTTTLANGIDPGEPNNTPPPGIPQSLTIVSQ